MGRIKLYQLKERKVIGFCLDGFEPQELDDKVHSINTTRNKTGIKFKFTNLLRQGRTEAARAIIIKYHTLGSLNRNLFAHSFRG